MRPCSTFAAFSAIAFAILGGYAQSQAAITSASVAESVNAHSVGNGVPDDIKSASNATLPPVSLSVTAASGTPLTDASSSITITTYSGPGDQNDPHYDLYINGFATAQESTVSSADYSFVYTFTIDAPENWIFTGETQGGFFSGDDQPQAFTGSGVIQPGTYTVGSTGSVSGNSGIVDGNFFLRLTPTPEPASLAFIGFGAIGLLRRHRRI
jgi:hypothetical protein